MSGHDHTAAAGASAPDQRRRLAVAFGITSVMLVAQAIGAFWTGSLALLTDTVHMLVDASGLLLALVTAHLVLRPASSRRTWGFRRLEVVAALGQAAVLLAVGVYAFIEGVERLFEPPSVPSTELLVFGVLGLLCNVLSIAVLSGGRQESLKHARRVPRSAQRRARLDRRDRRRDRDWTTGWQRADAVAGLFIAVLIVPRAFRLLHETVDVLMEFTPKGLDLDEVRRHLEHSDHVVGVHDLHASTIATGLPVLSAHVVLEDECFRDGHAPQVLEELKTCLAEHFPISIEHSTIQVETEDVEETEQHNHA